MNPLLPLPLLLALLITPLAAQEPPGPEDFREVAGILSWTFDIHPDTPDDEFCATEWIIPTEDGSLDKAPATGLDFRHVPAGGWVKLYLWVEPLWRPTEHTKGEIKFCLQYRGKDGKKRKDYGVLTLPEGYTSLSSHMPAGVVKDDGWLLMLTNPKTEKSCFLDFTYHHVPAGAE